MLSLLLLQTISKTSIIWVSVAKLLLWLNYACRLIWGQITCTAKAKTFQEFFHLHLIDQNERRKSPSRFFHSRWPYNWISLVKFQPQLEEKKKDPSTTLSTSSSLFWFSSESVVLNQLRSDLAWRGCKITGSNDTWYPVYPVELNCIRGCINTINNA